MLLTIFIKVIIQTKREETKIRLASTEEQQLNFSLIKKMIACFCLFICFFLFCLFCLFCYRQITAV